MTDRRKKQLFDKMMGFAGAYDLYKRNGYDQLVSELKKRGIQYKATRHENDHATRPDDKPAAVPIANDQERMEAKRRLLAVAPRAHDALLMLLGMDMLERVYNRALPSKAMTAQEHADRLFLMGERIIPAAVQDGLSRELGDDMAAHIIEALHAKLMFGRDTKPGNR